MEREVVAAIIKELRSRGCWAVKVHGGPYQAAGLPDIIGCTPDGTMLGIEVKDADKPRRGTALQETTLALMRAHGARAGVARSVAEAVGIVTQPQQSNP